LYIEIEKTKNEKRIITDEEFCFLRDFIYDKCGIYFRIEKKYLIEDKVIERMAHLNLRSVSDYIYYLKYNEKKDQEITVLYDYITINETSFFRNEPQFTVLKEEILDEIISRGNNLGLKYLKVWSAGCSSGEEPYTLSIVLNDYFESLKSTENKGNNKNNQSYNNWYFDILATDISQSVLNKAIKGVYGEYSLRTTDPKIISRCFNKISEKEYEIKNQYRQNVKFKKLNLLDNNDLSLLPSFDIIFCRNVLIYFDLNAKKKVLDSFYNLLKPNGYLFLGHSESLHGITSAFKLVLFQKALVYKKEV